MSGCSLRGSCGVQQGACGGRRNCGGGGGPQRLAQRGNGPCSGGGCPLVDRQFSAAASAQETPQANALADSLSQLDTQDPRVKEFFTDLMGWLMQWMEQQSPQQAGAELAAQG